LPAGVVSLVSNTLSVAEGDSVAIVVRRTGGTAGAAAFTIGVTGGTATAGTHFAFSGGTFTFANGDAADKTFTLSTVEDLVALDRSVAISISASGGSVLGAITTTTVTIQDNDACTLPDLPNPAAAPGAQALYFTQPPVPVGQVACRVIMSGDAIPAGRMNTALWQVGNARTAVSWDVGQFTGFRPGAAGEWAAHQRGPNNTTGTSAVQLRDGTVGLYVNSASAGVTPNGDILPAVMHVDFPSTADHRPFISANEELVYALDLQVPTAQRTGGGEVYAAAVLRFQETLSGRQVWFSIQALDLRGPQPEQTILDSCAACSQMPIILTTFAPGMRFGHVASDSATFSAAPWSGYRHFEFRVNRAEFSAAIQDVKTRFALNDAQLSPDASDYRLIHLNVNPEVYAPAGGGGRIGVSIQNVVLARHLVRPLLYDRVSFRGANASTSPLLQVFFTTAADGVWDEAKSLHATFPTGGATQEVVVSFRNHAAWAGTLTGLRIDPFDSSNPADCFNVDDIRLMDAAGNTALVWDFNGASGTPVSPFFGWELANIGALWTDGSVWGGCTAGFDPLFRTTTNVPVGR